MKVCEKAVIVSVALLGLMLTGGCETGFTGPKMGVEYKPIYEAMEELFSSRSNPATIATDPAETLREKGYIEIGSIVVQHAVSDECWEDKGRRLQSCSDCPPVAGTSDRTDELLRKAAAKGGDLVALEQHRVSEVESISKRGKCISKSTPRATVILDYDRYGKSYLRTVYMSECVDWETIEGKECVVVSRGTVWRYEPKPDNVLAMILKFKSKIDEKMQGNEPLRGPILYGYIDKTGKLVIQPKFEEAASFHEDLALVKFEGKYGFINRDGEFVITPTFESNPYIDARFYEGLARVQVAKKEGFINRSGEFVILPEFQAVLDFHEGLAMVEPGGTSDCSTGFIDHNGRMVIEKLCYANSFSEGLAAASTNPDYFAANCRGYINKDGVFVIKPQFYRADFFSEGMAAVAIGSSENHKWGYVDKEGNLVVKPRFEKASVFSEGLAVVELKGKDGYIDRNGEFVVEPTFEIATPFKDGLAAFEKGSYWGYIDKQGNIVIPPMFSDAKQFSEGIALVKVDINGEGVWGCIDKNGEIISDTVFDDAREFSEGLAVVGVRGGQSPSQVKEEQNVGESIEK